MASGMRMHSVARRLRNVTMHITSSAPKIAKFISQRALSTASLVAAVTPMLPVASLNSSLSDRARGAKSFTSRTRRAMVSPCWSVVFDQHLHRAAVGVQQARGGVDRRHRLRHHLRVARQLAPLEVALVEAGVDHLGQARQRDHRLRPGHVLHVPVEALDRRHDRRTGCRRPARPWSARRRRACSRRWRTSRRSSRCRGCSASRARSSGTPMP